MFKNTESEKGHPVHRAPEAHGFCATAFLEQITAQFCSRTLNLKKVTTLAELLWHFDCESPIFQCTNRVKGASNCLIWRTASHPQGCRKHIMFQQLGISAQ